jgi:streptogramin lyase
MRRRTALIPVATAALSLLATVVAPSANAAPEEEVVGGLITPLSVAVADDGTVYVTQNFAGMLTKASPGGEPEVIYADEGGREVGAVSVEGGVVTFATTGFSEESGPNADLYTLGGDGTQTRVANLFKFEKRNNPDGDTRYGFAGLTRSCKKKTPGRETYKGIIESHPYATNVDADGITYVADAAGNSILAVTDAGAVSAVAVLPVNKLKITRKVKRQYELPRCFIGGTWRAEPVPTDVELGPDGNLYVTSLPGGHETNGSVFKVDPATGDVTKLTGGLVGPVGLAIAPNGTAYISMLFASTILEVPFGGSPTVFAEVPFPGDVEVRGGHVYATLTDLMNEGDTPPNGKVVRWATGG